MSVAKKQQPVTMRDSTWILHEHAWELVPVVRRAGPWVTHLAPDSRHLYNVTLDGTGRAVKLKLTLVQAVALINDLHNRNHAAIMLGYRDGDAAVSWAQALIAARIT